MRKVLLILFLLFLLALAPVGAANFPEANAKQVAVKITNAENHFKNNRIGSGFQSIMDALLLTVSHSDLPGEVKSKVLEARAHFKDGVPNSQWYRLIHEALLLIKPAPEKRDPSLSIAGNLKKKLAAAGEQLTEKERNGGKVVEILLEAILVTSPPPTSPTSHTSPTGK